MGNTANAGQSYVVDPGSAEYTASDANTECATKTEPVTVDNEAGGGTIIYAYGTSLDDRKLLAVPVGE